MPKEQSSGALTEDSLLEVVLDAGAEEVNDLGESFEIVSEASDFVAIRKAVQEAGLDYESAEAEFVPNLQVELDVEPGVGPGQGRDGLADLVVGVQGVGLEVVELGQHDRQLLLG